MDVTVGVINWRRPENVVKIVAALQAQDTCHRANQNQPRGGEIRAAWVNGVYYRYDSYD